MVMATNGGLLSNVRDLLLPGVYMAAAHGHVGRDVKTADLSIDYLHDTIDLHVCHRLVTRREIDDQSYKRNVADKIKRALLWAEPTAKDLRVERRRLHWRGETARKGKPRKIIEDKA